MNSQPGYEDGSGHKPGHCNQENETKNAKYYGYNRYYQIKKRFIEDDQWDDRQDIGADHKNVKHETGKAKHQNGNN